MRLLRFEFSVVVVVAAILVFTRDTDAAVVTNGAAIGPNYNIDNIDAGVTVDFTGHTADGTNAGTIGKITLTPNHNALVWLGFTLKENAAATANSSASGGLRLLLDVSDTNGMTVPWIDYHIRAEDTSGPVNPGTQTAHLAVAHFHDTAPGFASNPLVLQGSGDNVIQLDFGLGAAVAPGGTFTATNILLHERDYEGLRREFEVETIPSVAPEPTTVLVWGLVAMLLGCTRGWRFGFGLTG